MKYVPITISIPEILSQRIEAHFAQHPAPSLNFIAGVLIREWIDDFAATIKERNEAPPPGGRYNDEP